MSGIAPPQPRRRVSLRGRITYFDASDACAVYQITGRDRGVIYVGSSHDPEARVRAHRSSQKWRGEIFGWSVEWYPGRRTAMRAEHRLIRELDPVYNFVGTELSRQVNRDRSYQRLAELKKQRVAAHGATASRSEEGLR